MPLDFMQSLFVLGVYFFVALWVMFGLIFILHFFVPKDLLQTYFKPPYFKQGEIVIFSGFPFAYLRTFMFMRLVAFPASGEKRGLTKAYQLAPTWFHMASKCLLIGFTAVVGILSFMFIFFLLDLYVW